VLAKLWSVVPKLFVRPPARSIAPLLDFEDPQLS